MLSNTKLYNLYDYGKFFDHVFAIFSAQRIIMLR